MRKYIYDKVHLKQWISTMVFRQGTWQKNSWFWKPQVCGSNLHTSMRRKHDQWLSDDQLQLRQSQTGWWFGTFLIFPYNRSNHPNWLSYFSEGLVNHQPAEIGWTFPLGPLGGTFFISKSHRRISVVSTQLLLAMTRQTMGLGMKQNQAIMRKNHINCTYLHIYMYTCIIIYIYILYRSIVDEFSRFCRFDFRHGPP